MPEEERNVHTVSAMHKALAPFLLRRLKSEVLSKELVEKKEIELVCQLTPLQEIMYQFITKNYTENIAIPQIVVSTDICSDQQGDAFTYLFIESPQLCTIPVPILVFFIWKPVLDCQVTGPYLSFMGHIIIQTTMILVPIISCILYFHGVKVSVKLQFLISLDTYHLGALYYILFSLLQYRMLPNYTTSI